MNSSAVALVVLGLCAGLQAQDGNVGWAHNGRLQGDHSSPLTRVTPANVAQLHEVWKFDMEPGSLESQPIVIGRTLYAITPSHRLVALDATNGNLKRQRCRPGNRHDQICLCRFGELQFDCWGARQRKAAEAEPRRRTRRACCGLGFDQVAGLPVLSLGGPDGNALL